MFLVGLTGNYGMGKSTVLKMFQRLGALTCDADEIAASLLREEMVLKKIRDLFGDRVFHASGSLGKKKVADIIFSDETSRRALENVIHPLIFEKISHLLDQEGRKDRIAVIETPILFERNYEEHFQRIITVTAERKLALERLENKGITEEEALQRIHSQLPVEEKIRRSDYTISNNGSMEETEIQVKTIYCKLLREVHDGDSSRAGSLTETIS
jgi:dephospho-CoA kinase